jgi:glutamate synthase (NADPH/NADH) small chain
VQLLELSAPVRFVLDEEGKVTGVELQRMELGEPDASGRRRPKPVEGSNFIQETDLAIVALGTRSNPLMLDCTPGLKLTDRNCIAVDENGETSIPNVYAGGDIVTGAATVILAMGAGRRAAQSIAKKMGLE